MNCSVDSCFFWETTRTPHKFTTEASSFASQDRQGRQGHHGCAGSRAKEIYMRQKRPAAANEIAEIYMCQKRPAAAPAAVFEAHGVKRCHMVERRRRRMRRRNLKA